MSEFDQFAGNYQQTLDDILKPSGTDSTYFAEHKAKWIANFLPARFAGKILDFGCGVGLLTHCLQQQLPEAQLHGYDVSSESLAAIPHALASRGLFATDLSAFDQDYDAIVISNVLHHIPPKERLTITLQLIKHLRPGGKLIVFEHNLLNPLTRYVVKHCPFDDDAILLPRKEVRNYMIQAALTIQLNHYVMFFPKILGYFNRFEKWLGWCPAGTQFVMVGSRDQTT